MGAIRVPIPSKPFVGILATNESFVDDCQHRLVHRFGPVDLVSPIVPWVHSIYYREEMGSPLVRQFFFFERLIDPGVLSRVKLDAMEIEEEFGTREGQRMRRRVNVDPGYLTEAKVVLATSKDFAHRIYIGQGVYAEVALQYSRDRKMFLPLAHTYADFRTALAQTLFLEARKLLRDALHTAQRDRLAPE